MQSREDRARVLFPLSEVCRLTGIVRPTLLRWIHRGWIRPAVPSSGGRGNEHQFSCWQAMSLAIISGHAYDLRSVNSYVGRTSVIRAMEALADRSDEELFPEEAQSPHCAESVAAEVARHALPANEGEQLSNAMVESLARVVAALDRKVRAIKEGTQRRMPNRAFTQAMNRKPHEAVNNAQRTAKKRLRVIADEDLLS